jgi:hypothetical protein
MEDLERQLADALRLYVAADDDVTRREHGRELSNTLAHVTGVLLEGEEGWSHYWWVDDLVEESFKTISPLAVDVHGVLIWGDERNQWIEPFQARIGLTARSDERPSYEIKLGDAATGLQRVAYGERQPRHWNSLDNWLFTLR